MRKYCFVLCMLLSASVSPAIAGTVMGNGGSTEITQIANNVVLAKQVAQNAQQIAVQITTATNTINTYMTAVQNLQHLPAAAMAKILEPYKGQVKDYAKLFQVVYGVYQSSSQLREILDQRYREVIAMKRSPREYIETEIRYAQVQGSDASARLKRDMELIKRNEAKAKELNDLMQSVPEKVTGNIQGLQLLNQQVAAMRAENLELRTAIQEQQRVLNQKMVSEARHDVQALKTKELIAAEREEIAKKYEKPVFEYPSLRFE